MQKVKLIISLLCLSIFCQLTGQEATDLLNKARYHRMSDLDSSNWYATQAYRVALESEFENVAMQSQFLLGMNLQMQGSLDQAISVFKQVLSSTPSNTYPEEYVQAYGRIGDCYTDLGSFDSAMVYLIQFDQLVDQYWSPNKVDAKLLLGELYRAMGRIDRSDEYKIEAIERAERSGNRMEQTIALYYYLDDHKKELYTASFQKYFQKYIQLKDQQKNDHMDHSHATMLLDDLEEGDRIMALETAIDAGSDKGFLPTLLFYRGTLIEIYLGQNDLQNAIRHAKQGLIETEKVEDKRYESDYHQYLFQIHEKLKNYDKAIYHLQVHHQLKDKLEDIRVSQNLDELNIQYETIKKESQIKQQELDLQKSRYQRNLLLAGFGMALWLGAFLIAYFWNRTRVTKRISIQETQIQEQKIQQLEQEKSLLAMSSMIEGQEAERKRIAQDLHDGLGGLLSNIKAQLHAIERRVNALTNLDVYGKASEMIDEASKEVRRIAYNMMPVTLSRLGLKAAIEDLVSEITKHHNLNVDLQLFGLDKRLDETEEVMLYRIVQELCNNVVKHAGATKMMVQTNRIGSDLILVVEDNGKGFDPVFTQSESGIGLKSIESRIKFLHSEIDISSSELGTCVTIQVPLKIQ